MIARFFRLCYDNVHAPRIFNETLKTWRKKKISIKHTQTFVLFNTQQEEDRLSNQPTYGTTGYNNTMIDSIVHYKMKSFINKMGPFCQSSSEKESVNDKNCSPNISTTTSANSVTMERIEQIFHKMFQYNNSKSTADTTIFSH